MSKLLTIGMTVPPEWISSRLTLWGASAAVCSSASSLHSVLAATVPRTGGQIKEIDMSEIPKLFDAVEGGLDEAVEMLKDLTRIPSRRWDEPAMLACVEHLRDVVVKLGG